MRAQKWSMSSNHVKLIISLVVEISGSQLQGGPILPMGAMEEWYGEEEKEEEQTLPLQVKKTNRDEEAWVSQKKTRAQSKKKNGGQRQEDQGQEKKEGEADGL